MAMNKEELLAAIRDNFSTLDYIRPSEIPNIDLYMDQVTTFMDNRLAKKMCIRDRHCPNRYATKLCNFSCCVF